MGRRPGRAAAKRAAAALESTPKAFAALDEDEPMADADAATNPEAEAEEEEAKPGDDADDDHESNENDNNSENNSNNGNDEQSGAEAEEEENQENRDSGSGRSPSPPRQPVIRRRRLGRPPKGRTQDWDSPAAHDGSQREDQPMPRRRGRGGYRGRGGRKGQQLSAAQRPVDKDGNAMEIVDDEVLLPDDPEGEKKVDKLGNLLGGREYRCRTFTILGRGQRLYMLSTEPARCVGFRDSYLFFTKHRKLYKIIVDEDEKRDMIERDIIPHSYKGRSIGVVTARSVFREFGALIIVGGRRIIDDYNLAKAKEDGVIEGELADPNDNWRPGEPYNKNQYVAWHGASAVYHQTGPAIQIQQVKVEPKKRRVGINDTNWMLEHAMDASQFNSQIAAQRAATLKTGIYDINTNVMLKPAIMQPTHVRIEQVRPGSSSSASSPQFPVLACRIERNFYIQDTYMETPRGGIPSSLYQQQIQGNSDPRDDILSSFRGLSAVSEEMRDLLPQECRKAFDKAVENERLFKAGRGTEAEMTHRREPRIDKALFPYNAL